MKLPAKEKEPSPDHLALRSAGVVPLTLLAITVIAGVILVTVLITQSVLDHSTKIRGGHVVQQRFSVGPQRGSAIDARCPRGEIATGGGLFAATKGPDLAVLNSYPTSLPGATRWTPAGWHLYVFNVSLAPITSGVVAICVPSA